MASAVQRDDGTLQASDALSLSQVTAALTRPDELEGASEPGHDECDSVGAPASMTMCLSAP